MSSGRIIKKYDMKVSIIVPCYNQEIYISQALDSVLAQTFSDWECIIIDDGSTDSSAQIVQEYIKKDKRFSYIYQPNKGVCCARNNAINKALGKYILCLDADDIITPDYLELSVKELDKDSKVTLVTCNYKYFGKRHSKVFLEPYSIERLMGHNLFINCSMFRKIDFERVDGFNENMKQGLEDWDFWISILKNGGKVKYLEGFHFFYRIKSTKESRNMSTALIQYDKLRKQIWSNHKELYSSKYSSPQMSLEFIQIYNSKEYRIGKILLKPFRYLFNFFILK